MSGDSLLSYCGMNFRDGVGAKRKVVESSVSAGQWDFRSGFDSRQLHQKARFYARSR
jgi:hypothetical protein